MFSWNNLIVKVEHSIMKPEQLFYFNKKLFQLQKMFQREIDI